MNVQDFKKQLEQLKIKKGGKVVWKKHLILTF